MVYKRKPNVAMPAALLAVLAAARASCTPVIMNYGHFCEGGKTNLTLADCQTAADNSKRNTVISNMAGKDISQSNWPSGCIYKTADGSMWYNQDTTNTANSEMRAVCCLPNDINREMAQLPADGNCNLPNNYLMIIDKADCESFAYAAAVNDVTTDPGVGTGGCYKDISNTPPTFHYNPHNLLYNVTDVTHAPICYTYAATAPPLATEIWLTGGVDLTPTRCAWGAVLLDVRPNWDVTESPTGGELAYSNVPNVDACKAKCDDAGIYCFTIVYGGTDNDYNCWLYQFTTNLNDVTTGETNAQMYNCIDPHPNNPDGTIGRVLVDQGGHTDATCPQGENVVCSSCEVQVPPDWNIDPTSSRPIDGRQGHTVVSQMYGSLDIALCYIGGADAQFMDDAVAAVSGIQSYVCNQVSDKKEIHGEAVSMVSSNDQPWSPFLSASAKLPGGDTFIFGGYQTENDLVLWKGQLLSVVPFDKLVLTSRFSPGTYFADHALIAMSDATTDNPTLYIVGGYNPKKTGNQPIHQSIISFEAPLQDIEVASMAIITTPLSGQNLPYGVDRGVHGAAAVLVNDRYIWIIGGCLGTFVGTCECTSKTVQFDTETGIVMALPDLAHPRCDARAIIDVVDNKPGVYVVGGWKHVNGGAATVHTVEYVNTDKIDSTGAWQQTSNCTQTCADGGAACNSLERVRFALATSPRLEDLPTTATSSATTSQTTTAQSSTSVTSTATITATSTGSTSATRSVTSSPTTTVTTTPTTTYTTTTAKPKPPDNSRSNKIEKWLAKDNETHVALICGGVVVLIFSCICVTKFISGKNGYSEVSNGDDEIEMSDFNKLKQDVLKDDGKKDISAHFL